MDFALQIVKTLGVLKKLDIPDGLVGRGCPGSLCWQTCVVVAACMGQGEETGGELVGKGSRSAGERRSL